MIKRAIHDITNIKAINNLPTKASIEDCLCCILEQDFKFNKWITPNTLELLKKYYGNYKLSFKNDYFFVNNKKYAISYQLKCEMYIFKLLIKNLDNKLKRYFFEKTEYGVLSKNIKIEVTHPGILDDKYRYRVDLEIILDNGYKIIIEVNEKLHENDGKKYLEINRARQILDDDKKIKKFYILREKYIENDLNKLKKFTKDILIPNLKEISTIHNEREYVIAKLIEYIGIFDKNYEKIYELIYDSHCNPKELIIDIDELNNMFDLNWTDDYISVIKKLTENDILTDEINNDLSDDDLLGEDIIDDELCDNKPFVKENTYDYYKFTNDKIKLTWKGFNTYLLFIIDPLKEKGRFNQCKQVNEFHYKITTEFINIIKEQRDKLIKMSETSRIWGYRDEDYEVM